MNPEKRLLAAIFGPGDKVLAEIDDTTSFEAAALRVEDHKPIDADDIRHLFLAQASYEGQDAVDEDVIIVTRPQAERLVEVLKEWLNDG